MIATDTVQPTGALDIAQIAVVLDDAAHESREIDRISLSQPLDLAAAYAVQQASIARRLARGEKMVGVKMGFTSIAKMRQMGVDESIWGRLTDAMAVPNGGTTVFQRYIHPRVEPEVAFLLKSPLSGVVSREAAIAAIAAVAPAAEIIDSRYRDFKFTHEDVVADNCSSSGFALGAWQPLSDLTALDVTMAIDGVTVQTGSTAAILGDPVESLISAAKLTAASEPLQAGWVVLAGAATAAVALQPGMAVRVSVGILGDVTFHVSE